MFTLVTLETGVRLVLPISNIHKILIIHPCLFICYRPVLSGQLLDSRVGVQLFEARHPVLPLSSWFDSDRAEQ